LMSPSFSRCAMATRASEPLIFMRSMRTDCGAGQTHSQHWQRGNATALGRRTCEIILNVGTSFMMRSKVGLSQMTAFCALSLTLPFDHFFFLAEALDWDDAPAAAAFALHDERRGRVSVGVVPRRR